MRAVMLCVAAFAGACLLSYLYGKGILNKFSLFINHKTIYSDIWDNVVDYENGTTVRIVCDNATYAGVLAEREEKGNESWIVLEEYAVEKNGEIYASKDMQYKSKLMINLKDAKRIELYYGN